MQQGLADIAISMVGWVLLVVQTPNLFQRARQANRRQVVSFWLFILAFSVSFTLQIDPLYLFIDRSLGANNLCWWLSYASIIIGLAFLADACHQIEEARLPFGATIHHLAAATLGIVTVFYLLILRGSPESLQHDLPASPGELAYIVVLHLYGIVALSAPAQMLRATLARETLLPGLLRSGLFLVALLATELWLVFKLVHIVLRPLTPAVAILPGTFPLLMLLTALSLAGALLLPKAAFVGLGHALEQGRDLLALLESRWLAQRLKGVCPPLHQEEVPLAQQLRRAPLYLRRQVIYVLDSRKTWVAHELPLDGQRLYTVLQSLPLAELEYQDYVRVCCRASRRLWLQDMRATGRAWLNLKD